MTPRIQYNVIADFVFSIFRILEVEIYKKNDFIQRFKANQDILEYIEYVHKNINPILKRDMEYSCGKFYRGLLVLLKYATDEKIDDIKSLIENIDNMSGKEFVNLIIEKLNLNIPKDVSNKELKKIFEEQITNGLDNLDVVQIYIDYFKYPDDMKHRLVKTLCNYYNEFFKAIEEDVKSFMSEKLKKHKHLLQKDNDQFFENIVFVMHKEQVINAEVEFYIDYFSEFGCCIFEMNNKYTVYYGYSLEQRFDDKMKSIEYKELIKILSDENRFNIIKELGKRAWYSKELADHFGITTATMSYHIKKITALGIIDIDSGKNKRLYYKLNKDKFKKIVNNMVVDVIEDK